MLCLRTDNILNIVCPQTLLGLKVYHKPVSDFAVIENNDNSLCQILVLTTNDDECTMRTLRVLSFPGMKYNAIYIIFDLFLFLLLLFNYSFLYRI